MIGRRFVLFLNLLGSLGATFWTLSVCELPAYQSSLTHEGLCSSSGLWNMDWRAAGLIIQLQGYFHNTFSSQMLLASPFFLIIGGGAETAMAVVCASIAELVPPEKRYDVTSHIVQKYQVVKAKPETRQVLPLTHLG